MSTCQTCDDLRASWSPLDNGEVPPRCPEHKGSSSAPAVGHDRVTREAAAFRAMARFGITVGSWDGKNWRASCWKSNETTPQDYPSQLEAVEAMALACERAPQALSPWPTAEGLEIALIDVVRRSDDYMAQLRDQPGVWACGPTSMSALGDLVSTHYERFRIAIKWPHGGTTANHPEAEVKR